MFFVKPQGQTMFCVWPSTRGGCWLVHLVWHEIDYWKICLICHWGGRSPHSWEICLLILPGKRFFLDPNVLTTCSTSLFPESFWSGHSLSCDFRLSIIEHKIKRRAMHICSKQRVLTKHQTKQNNNHNKNSSKSFMCLWDFRKNLFFHFKIERIFHSQVLFIQN